MSDEGGYEDEEFEDYDDDFEADEEEAAPAPAAPAAAKPPLPPAGPPLPVKPLSLNETILQENRAALNAAQRGGGPAGAGGGVSFRAASPVEQLPERQSVGLPGGLAPGDGPGAGTAGGAAGGFGAPSGLGGLGGPQGGPKRMLASSVEKWRWICAHVSMSSVGDASLLDLPPRSAHSLFEMGDGQYSSVSSKEVQAGGGGGAETTHFSAQTEAPARGARATQCPEAGGAEGRRAGGDARAPAGAPHAPWGSSLAAGAGSSNRERQLRTFLASVARTVEDALEENARARPPPRLDPAYTSGPPGPGSCAERVATLALDPVLQGRPVVAVAYAPVASSGQLMAVYGPETRMLPGSVVAAAGGAGKENGGAGGGNGAGGPDGGGGGARQPLAPAMGCAAVWELPDGGRPSVTHLLVAEGLPACCCWGPPAFPAVALAGTEEGGICLWDLREADTAHPLGSFGGGGPSVPPGASLPCRRPTYMTDGSPLDGAYDVSAIVSLAAVEDDSSSAALAGAAGSGAGAGAGIAGIAGGAGGGPRRAFHVIALNAWGRIDVWTVSELIGSDAAGSDLDRGLRFGGRVRMIRTATRLHVGPLTARAAGGGGGGGGRAALGAGKPAAAGGKTGDAGRANGEGKEGKSSKEAAATPAFGSQDTFLAFGLAAEPGQPNRFVIAADGGRLLRGARFGAPPPRAYALGAGVGGAGAAGADAAAAMAPAGGRAGAGRLPARCVAFSPFVQGLFLSGYEDGSVGLFSAASAVALLAWRDFSRGSIVAVRWSPARPALFYVLDSLSTLYAWDVTAHPALAAAGAGRGGASAGASGGGGSGAGESAGARSAPQPLHVESLGGDGALKSERARGGGWGSANALTLDASPAPLGALGAGLAGAADARGAALAGAGGAAAAAYPAALAVGFADGGLKVLLLGATGPHGVATAGELAALQALMDE